MKDTLAGMVERARATLSTISLGQKVVIGLLLAGLLLGGFYFVSWITTPAQAPLFSNLAAKDASAIVDELNAESVPYTLTDGGQTIMVPQDKVFVTEQAKPTASVLLDLSPGTQLSGEQVQAVTNLVSSAIQGMDPNQVTVADSTGQVLSA